MSGENAQTMHLYCPALQKYYTLDSISEAHQDGRHIFENPRDKNCYTEIRVWLAALNKTVFNYTIPADSTQTAQVCASERAALWCTMLAHVHTEAQGRETLMREMRGGAAIRERRFLVRVCASLPTTSFAPQWTAHVNSGTVALTHFYWLLEFKIFP